MATTPKNRIVRSPSPNQLFVDAKPIIDATVNLNQGDLAILKAGKLQEGLSDADGQLALGIMGITLVDGKAKSPYQGTAVDAAQALESVPGPFFGVEASLKLKSGDAFAPGDYVYYSGVDAQTVSSAGANPIGVYIDVAKTGTGSNEGIIRIGNRFNVPQM